MFIYIYNTIYLITINNLYKLLIIYIINVYIYIINVYIYL
jgi:hypothetical protein